MPLQPEDRVHEEIKQKLEDAGWLNGNEVYGIKEHSLIENNYLAKILEKRLRK